MSPETAAAVMAEREAAAIECDELSETDSSGPWAESPGFQEGAEACAAAIRARPAPVVEPADWGDIAQAAARKILTSLGYAQDGAQDPGADRRRDTVARLVQEATEAALADLPRAEG